MKTEPTNAEKIRRLPWAYTYNAFNTGFVYLTVFGSVFMLFLDELRLDKQQIGVLLSLFPFCGMIAVIIGPSVARFGLKRTFILFWTLRNLVVALLMGTPWVIASFGTPAAFYYVGAIVLIFAVCRAAGMTALYPWAQQYVPDSIRGRFLATEHIIMTVAGIGSMALASLVLASSEQLTRFIWLFAVGVTFGLISVACGTMIPGGGPAPPSPGQAAGIGGMVRPLRDRRFLLYLLVMAIFWLGMRPLITFIPLYLKDAVGLKPDQVTLLEIAAMVAIASASIPWGWAADRYGSKPVAVLSLGMLMVIPPALLLIPRGSLPAAAAVLFVHGLINTGVIIGFSRLLFNTLIPPSYRTAYTAVFYAWTGFVGGISPLFGGWVLERYKHLDAVWLGLPIDAYSPLMLAYMVSLPTAVWLLGRLRSDGEMPTLAFAGMFFRGDPFGALGALVRYTFAGEEITRVVGAQRLGQSRSPLNVDELIESLADPSFNVRYEAIVSIARTRPDPRLTAVLIDILNGNEHDLQIAAAWALGRVGDPRGIEPLRELLASGYPLLAARCARALGMLGNQQSVPFLLARLHDELDDGLRIAYASALGALRCGVAVPELLVFLRDTPADAARFELALALARIAGNETKFIRLWRQIRQDAPASLAQAVEGLRRKIAKAFPDRPELAKLARECSNSFADDHGPPATRLLAELIRRLPHDAISELARAILEGVGSGLMDHGADRIEYIVLAIDTLSEVLTTTLDPTRGR